MEEGVPGGSEATDADVSLSWTIEAEELGIDDADENITCSCSGDNHLASTDGDTVNAYIRSETNNDRKPFSGQAECRSPGVENDAVTGLS